MRSSKIKSEGSLTAFLLIIFLGSLPILLGAEAFSGGGAVSFHLLHKTFIVPKYLRTMIGHISMKGIENHLLFLHHAR